MFPLCGSMRANGPHGIPWAVPIPVGETGITDAFASDAVLLTDPAIGPRDNSELFSSESAPDRIFARIVVVWVSSRRYHANCCLSAVRVVGKRPGPAAGGWRSLVERQDRDGASER